MILSHFNWCYNSDVTLTIISFRSAVLWSVSILAEFSILHEAGSENLVTGYTGLYNALRLFVRVLGFGLSVTNGLQYVKNDHVLHQLSDF